MEAVCRRAVVLRRQGLSLMKVAAELGKEKWEVQRLLKRIARNGRFCRSVAEKKRQVRRASATVSVVPVLINGNTLKNFTLVDDDCIRYARLPQSHNGWCQIPNSCSLRRTLRENRSAYSKMGKKVPSARTLRRYRQVESGRNLEPGPRFRKNWAAVEHFRKASSAATRSQPRAAR